jgi:flagellin-specific chaperone FliS
MTCETSNKVAENLFAIYDGIRDGALQPTEAANQIASMNAVTTMMQTQINAFKALSQARRDQRKFAVTLGEKRALLEDDPDLADQD